MKYKISNRGDYESQMNGEITREDITKWEKLIKKNEINIKKIIKKSNDDYSTQVKEANRILHMTKRSVLGFKYINLINGYLAIVDITLKEMLNNKKEMLPKKQEKNPAMTDYMNQEGKLNILIHPISYNINHSLELLMKYLIQLSGAKLLHIHDSKELYKKTEEIIKENYSKYKVKLRKYKNEQEKKYGRNEHHTKIFNEKVYMKGYGLVIHTKYLETLVNRYTAENKNNTLDRYPKGKKKKYKIKDLKLLYKDMGKIRQIQKIFIIITTN